MQRYNSFNMIHKALRALLYDTALSLQQTYFADAAEAETALQKVAIAIQQFEQHARHEDRYILPAIEKFEPQLVMEFEKEHEIDEALGKRLQQLLNIFRGTTLAEERVIAGSALVKGFNDFLIFNLQHMAKEESILNQALWAHYTDEELLQINYQIVSNIPDEEKAISSKWMMRGINKMEAINWLKAMKQHAPEPAFWSVYSLVRSELPVHLRIEVQESMIEQQLIY
jgi:hypothetical protein